MRRIGLPNDRKDPRLKVHDAIKRRDYRAALVALIEDPELGHTADSIGRTPLLLALERRNVTLFDAICSIVPSAIETCASRCNIMHIAVHVNCVPAMHRIHAKCPSLLDKYNWIAGVTLYAARKSRKLVTACHALGTEAHFMKMHREPPVTFHRHTGAFTRTLYFSRSLSEVLFFASEDK